MVDKLLKKTNKLPTKELKSFGSIFSCFEGREKTPYYIKLFEETGVCDSTIYIGCSGGPDSMFLMFLLIWYRHVVKGQNLSITKIIHINHNTSESDLFLEENVMKTFGKIFDIHILHIEKSNFTETVLRKKRWDFYKHCIQKSEPGCNVYLCLGHNLNDRIENSLLHFDRGTHIGGIVNMQLIQEKHLFFGDEVKTYTCFRPLLSFPKEKITGWCDYFGVPYGHDTHNKDVTQKRIQYRNSIQSLSFMKQQQVYNEWGYVYSVLEQGVSKQPSLTKIFSPLCWDVQGLYKTDLPTTELELVALLSTIDLFTNMSKIRLQEMMKWFHKKEGAFYLNGWRFLSVYGELFLAKQDKKDKFREKNNTEEIQIREDSVLYSIAGYLREVSESKFYGAVLTFPAIGDTVGSKKYMKRAARQRIPFFRRRSLPILKKNNRIIAVLPSSLRSWTL